MTKVFDALVAGSDASSVRAELGQVRSMEKTIEQRLIDYYADSRDRFGAPRKSRVVGGRTNVGRPRFPPSSPH